MSKLLLSTFGLSVMLIMTVLLSACDLSEAAKYKSEKLLLKAYAAGWEDEDDQLLYNQLSQETRNQWPYEKFKRLLEADKLVNGGLKKIDDIKEVSDNDVESVWSMTLVYKYSTARDKQIRNIVIRDGDYCFLRDGGLLPPSVSSFNR